MDKIATASLGERTALFREAAIRRGLNLQIVEKDFWVCWTLKQLFGIASLTNHLIFKGGTSLSKAYGIIERFSEDIDIAVDRKYLGIPEILDLRDFSVSKRDAIIADLDAACASAVQTYVLPQMKESCSRVIGESGPDEWQLSIDPGDEYGQTILFNYPRERSLPTELAYVLPVVRL
ncbi:MAG: nucleotidyl transferase AbiEii/AbiGii toxin family protein [Pyrinomonadaceae bacterium]